MERKRQRERGREGGRTREGRTSPRFVRELSITCGHAKFSALKPKPWKFMSTFWCHVDNRNNSVVFNSFLNQSINFKLPTQEQIEKGLL